MTSETNNFFKIQGTLNAKYKIINNFIEVKTNEFALQYQRDKQNEPFLEEIGYIRIGIGYYSNPPSKRWDVKIFSQEIKINKEILFDGCVIIKPKKFLIPIASIKNLSKYWFVVEMGKLKKKNTEINTVYIHSKKDIFK